MPRRRRPTSLAGVFILTYALFAAQGCVAQRVSLSDRVAEHVAAREIVTSVLKAERGVPGIGRGAAEHIAALVDRPLEEKIARGYVIVYPFGVPDRNLSL